MRASLRQLGGMDNLTHSLVGALLGQMGLKRKTGLAMPTLIIAANIPDIDAVAVLLGGHQHLAIRRGITHGPIAMVILPLLLWALMLRFDAWQTKRGKRPEKRLPVHNGWLLALAFIGCLSHPLFDWFNSYGVRLLEPFSSQWFYGDTLFIIDIWIWAALIVGVWLSLRRERFGAGKWQRPAWIGFMATCLYIGLNQSITMRAEKLASHQISKELRSPPTLVVANPMPFTFWKREILWRNGEDYGRAQYGAFGEGLKLDHKSLNVLCLPNCKIPSILVSRPHYMHDLRAAGAGRGHPEAEAFLFWSRMPVAKVHGENGQQKLVIFDQRFDDPRVRSSFTVSIPWKERRK